MNAKNETKKVKKETPAKEQKEKKEPRPLTEDQARTLASLQAIGGNLVEAFSKAALPKQALYRFTVELNEKFRASIRAHTVDPTVRRKTRLLDRIAKLQAELAVVEKGAAA